MSTQNNGFQPSNCTCGIDYELWVLNLLILAGFKAKRTGKDDNGIDIIAEICLNDTNYKFYIQCKFYNKPVGKAPVQEVCTGNIYYGNDGYPVVITNNRMTVDALKYAKTVGVEVIDQQGFNELAMIIQKKLAIEDICQHSGLLGIIIGQHYKNSDYLNKSVNSYQNFNSGKSTDRVTKIQNDIVSAFDEAEILIREAADFQSQSIHKCKQALNLQRNAMLKHLEYPDTTMSEHILGGLTMSDLFAQLLESVKTLTTDQLEQLNTAILNRKSEDEKYGNDIKCFDFTPCVHCGSVNTKRNGKVRGKQRFFCKDCKKTFGYSTGTVTVNSRLNEQQWKIIIRGMIGNHSMSEIAKEAGLSPSSVWVNKIKLCAVLYSLHSEQDNFVDIAECDEYYAPTSFKGKRDPDFFINILHRMPRHHWNRWQKEEWLIKNGFYDQFANDPDKLEEILASGDKKQRGISSDQTCILTCQDRSGHLVMVPVCFGRLETNDVKKNLSGRFPTDGIMVTDSHQSYPKFAEDEEIQLEQIESGKHTKGAFNLARINALHSDLAAYWNTKRENIPATKYMDLSLIFMWWLRKNKDLSVTEQIDKLYAIIIDPTLQIDIEYETIKNREINLNTKNLIPDTIKRL